MVRAQLAEFTAELNSLTASLGEIMTNSAAVIEASGAPDRSPRQTSDYNVELKALRQQLLEGDIEALDRNGWLDSCIGREKAQSIREKLELFEFEEAVAELDEVTS